MYQASATQHLLDTQTSSRYRYLLYAMMAGLLLPLGFAPFHLPGLALLSIALFFILIRNQSIKKASLSGFAYGFGSLGFGVSWVYVSIHIYGHLNPLVSGIITLIFIAYLSVFTALVGGAYSYLAKKDSLLFCCFLFSALWCVGEYLRSTFMGGFPWLLLGFGQVDTPIKFLLPLFGVFGASFFACLSATFLAAIILSQKNSRLIWTISFVAILIVPYALNNIVWSVDNSAPLPVAVIQANKSMRDKWDEDLFWQLQQDYQAWAERLIKSNKVVVMPESAIPVSSTYISDFLAILDAKATKAESAILLGSLLPANMDENILYNAMVALGTAQGTYQKQHLVPFGEYIPYPFHYIVEWLAFPIATLKAGEKDQPLIVVQNHPIASLICYELAYPQILRKQLPLAEWIVSISDDGWFGHSFAMFQQLQMAQTLSMQTARYQVVANNDGLSSIIDAQGNIVSSLPAHNEGILESNIKPMTGLTPWIYWGDMPLFAVCFLILTLAVFYKKEKKMETYP